MGAAEKINNNLRPSKRKWLKDLPIVLDLCQSLEFMDLTELLP
jgi:hypothetical protein